MNHCSADGESAKRGVIGVIRHESRVLMIQRADCVAKGGSWCFPGGHIEGDETSAQAIVREMEEELNIAVQPIRNLGRISVQDSGHELTVWLIEQTGGTMHPEPSEVADVSWVAIDDILIIPNGLPTNANVARMLAQLTA